MSRPINPSIGTAPCPIAECGQVCQVKKFAHRATKDLQRRFAGRLYLDCPDHGRIGADGRPGMQEYILTRGTIHGEEPPPAPKAAEPTEPKAAPNTPQPRAAAAPNKSNTAPPPAGPKPATELFFGAWK